MEEVLMDSEMTIPFEGFLVKEVAGFFYHG
jgi:hypothetical protein